MFHKSTLNRVLDDSCGFEDGTGVAGKVFTSKVNGNSLFFPAAGSCDDSSVYRVGSEGYFRSASWFSSYLAWVLYFGSGSQGVGGNGRYCGFSVRGVCE